MLSISSGYLFYLIFFSLISYLCGILSVYLNHDIKWTDVLSALSTTFGVVFALLCYTSWEENKRKEQIHFICLERVNSVVSLEVEFRAALLSIFRVVPAPGNIAPTTSDIKEILTDIELCRRHVKSYLLMAGSDALKLNCLSKKYSLECEGILHSIALKAQDMYQTLFSMSTIIDAIYNHNLKFDDSIFRTYKLMNRILEEVQGLAFDFSKIEMQKYVVNINGKSI
ncbi:Uncharacterised protein [Chromobacterium violaceum]|uniref:DUF4760 domain-containing protein n=1 Tax=Chromobacterium violaceum TaxID=536 RepID=A0A447T936_CHRVL|nr:Uncharacterised protein [Chromobacterium violaceum]